MNPLDFTPDDFNAYLAEMYPDGGGNAAFLRQQYREKNNFTNMLPDGGVADGRQPIAGGFASKDIGTTGREAMRSLRPAIWNGIMGLLQGGGEAVQAPLDAYRGLLSPAEMTGAAMGTAGMAMGGGMAASGRGLLDYDPNTVSAGGARPEMRVYHGGNKTVTSPKVTVDGEGLLDGFSVTPNLDVAEFYARLRDGSAVSKFDIDPDSLKTISEAELYELQERLEFSLGLDEGDLPDARLLSEVKSLGFNAIQYPDPEFGLRVINPDILKPTPRTAAEAMAKQVLEMRAAGNAGDVTDDMMAMADDPYMFNNTPLDMSAEGRMGRAGDINTSLPLYHGGSRDFNDFRPSVRGKIGPGVYLTPDARKANRFSGYEYGPTERIEKMLNEDNLRKSEVYPVFATNAPAPMDVRMQARTERSAYDDDIDAYRKVFDEGGYDGVRVEDERTILNPANIRSQYARFDPAFKHLRNLSAGVAGVGLLSQADQRQQRRGLLE